MEDIDKPVRFIFLGAKQRGRNISKDNGEKIILKGEFPFQKD